MKRRNEVAVGVLITVATAVLILGALWLARGGLSSGYPLYTRFRWGQNLKQGQPVLLAGVNVGYVSKVDLRNDGYLDVMLRIDDDRKIPKGSVTQVQPVGFFGDVQVALLPQLGPNPQSYAPGDTVPAGPLVPTVGDVLMRVDSMGATLTDMTMALDKEFVQSGAFKDLRRMIANSTALSVQLQSIAAQQNANLTATLAAYRHAASAIDSARISATLANLQETSANTTRLVADLDSTTRRMNGIVAQLDQGRGTAGKLLTDDQLYRDLHTLVSRSDSLIADFKANPKKYVKLSIF